MVSYGYWIFGKDMTSVNLKTLQGKGVTDIFLNYYAINTYGKTKVIDFIKEAEKYNINTHIWCQCFYDGSWHNPKTWDYTNKIKEIVSYSKLDGVKGIHLDYLRYPSNAYKTSGGADAITNFVKKVKKQIGKDIILSCAVMPEESSKYDYGQDISALGKIVDMILPMQYKGNYNSGTSWLKSTTKSLSGKATIWSGLQTYKSDDNPSKLSSSELLDDCKVCLDNGAKGVVLFRYGLSNLIDFTTLNPKTTSKESSGTGNSINSATVKKIASSLKKYIEVNKKLPSSLTVDGVKYTYSQMGYILCYNIQYPNKKVSVISVSKPSNPTGDTVNETLSKADYLDVTKRLLDYTVNNKRLPNYVVIKKSKKKLNPLSYMDMLARIVNYYYTHENTLPLTAKVKSKI